MMASEQRACRQHCLADRAKDESGKAAEAPRPDHKEVSSFAGLDERLGRRLLMGRASCDDPGSQLGHARHSLIDKSLHAPLDLVLVW